MAGLSIDMYVGFHIGADAANIEIYDSGAASAAQFTIPSGTYFFNHETSAHNIIAAINAVLPSGYSLGYYNDRQVSFSCTGGDRYFRLPTSDDQTVLAHALGLYNNSGNTAYFAGSYAGDNWVGQATLTAVYMRDIGLIYPSHDLYGYPTSNDMIHRSSSGKITRISTGKVREITITWQHCSGDICGGDLSPGTQATLGATSASGWSASFDVALDPLWREPVFHIQSAVYGNFTYYMDFVVDKGMKEMTVARWNGLFDVTFGVCLYTEAFS